MRRGLFTFLSAVALIATGVVGALAVGGTGTVDPPPRIAFLANGINPADALAAGGIAGQLGAPLFTTRAETLSEDARDGLIAYAPELVIVLGGPVAVEEPVVNALAAAVGLPVVATPTPTSGIVRVAGADRFATARAVADLLVAYDPAYLRVDATALGAVDADQVDGRDADEFALADQSCPVGQAVTGIAADGTPDCGPVQASGAFVETIRTTVPFDTGDDLSISHRADRSDVGNPSAGQAYLLIPFSPQFPPGVTNLELVGLTICLGLGAIDLDLGQVATSTVTDSVTLEMLGDVLVDNTCTSVPLGGRHIVDASTHASAYFALDAGTVVAFGPITATWEPTATSPADNQSVDPDTLIPVEP